jgi:hypothetical protein
LKVSSLFIFRIPPYRLIFYLNDISYSLSDYSNGT